MYKSHTYVKFIPENHYILFDAIGNGTVFWISFSDYLLLFVQLFCNRMDCSPSGSYVHGIFQARLLEWVAIPSSRGSSWPRDWTHVSKSSALQVDSLPLSHQGSPSDNCLHIEAQLIFSCLYDLLSTTWLIYYSSRLFLWNPGFLYIGSYRLWIQFHFFLYYLVALKFLFNVFLCLTLLLESPIRLDSPVRIFSQYWMAKADILVLILILAGKKSVSHH